MKCTIENILKKGGDKVFLNSSVIKNPKFINQAVNVFGSSTIGISLEISTSPFGNFNLLYNYGREHTNKNVIDWIKEIQDRGAGEIFITSVNYEGIGQGMDLKLLDIINEKIEIPFPQRTVHIKKTD